MKPKTRDRAARVIVASLINSELTPAELDEVAHLFLSTPQFSSDLGSILDETAKVLRTKGDRAMGSSEESKHSGEHDPVRDVLRAVKRSRMPKHELLAVIQQVYPSVVFPTAESATAEEIVRGLQKWDPTLLKLIGRLRTAGQKPDEYLQGIMSRGDEKR